jgi:hypothetical protein
MIFIGLLIGFVIGCGCNPRHNTKPITKQIPERKKVIAGYLINTHNNQQFIQCLVCDKKSFNPGDIQHKYCSNCNKFH